MSRQPVLAGGFLPHGHGHGHGHGHNHVANGHYGVHAQSAYENAIHSGLAFGRPLPIRAPVLAPAFNLNHQHTGQHQHQHPHGRNPNFAMADQQYMPSDDDYAHLQKLSSEFEPEVAVSALPILPACLLACLLALPAVRAAHLTRLH
jgi:ubiquitin thioesterase protein OTUB1